jgi:hypothetical protein
MLQITNLNNLFVTLKIKDVAIINVKFEWFINAFCLIF